MRVIVVGVGVLLVVSGCTTSVTVRKVDPNQFSNDPLVAKADPSKTTNGVHFWLPQPYLLVTPAADGTQNYQWLFLQDYDHEYAVDYDSKFAALNLDVQTQSGILKSVGIKQDASAVAAKAAANAATVATAKKQTEAAQEQQVSQNQLAVAQAQAALTATEASINSKDSAAVTAAKVALAQAQAKAKFAAQPSGTQTPSSPGANGPGNSGSTPTSPGSALPGGTAPGGTAPGGTAPGGTAPGGTAPGGTAPGGTAPAPSASPGSMYVYGPVLFKVVQTQRGVTLIPVNVNSASAQPQYLTNVVPPSSSTSAQTGFDISVSKATATQLTLQASQGVYANTSQTLTIQHGDSQQDLHQLEQSLVIRPMTISNGGKTIMISWSPPLGAGNYGVTLQLSPAMGAAAQGKTVLFRIPTP